MRWCVWCVLCADIRGLHGLRSVFFFQAEDGIRDLVRSRGLGDVYKRQRGHSLPANQQGQSNPPGRDSLRHKTWP